MYFFHFFAFEAISKQFWHSSVLCNLIRRRLEFVEPSSLDNSSSFINNPIYENVFNFTNLRSSARLCNFWDFGTSDSRSTKIRQLKIRNPSHPFRNSRSREFVSRKPSTHSSKRRYPRCDKGMALFFVSGLSTCNRRLGLNVSASRNSHLRGCVSRTLVPPVAIFRDAIGQR
jgi:hypothetical protein